jgi:D-alanyl-D-alanine carboxypeptidase
MSRNETIRARATYVASRLESAARELLRRGAYAVAARLAVPALDEPIRVAVGSVDAAGSAPLTGEELFAVASQSKMLTAACVLLLAGEGATSLDDPVAMYVPDVPAVDEDATIAQFLNHTSGIGNFIHAMTVLPHPWPRMSYEDLMALARMHGRQFRAGERLDYNNTDVVVLARLCERVGGMPLAKLLWQRIFEPLGMRDTFVAQGEDWPRSRMARGYYFPSQGYEGPMIDVSTLADYSIASAAGNVVSSLADMMRFACCLLGKASAIGLGTADFVAVVAEAGREYANWFFPRTYGCGV